MINIVTLKLSVSNSSFFCVYFSLLQLLLNKVIIQTNDLGVCAKFTSRRQSHAIILHDGIRAQVDHRGMLHFAQFLNEVLEVVIADKAEHGMTQPGELFSRSLVGIAAFLH